MMPRSSDSCLIQFAKAPVLGAVKTRLEPALGQVGCVALHRALVSWVFSRHLSVAQVDSEVWSDCKHAFFDALLAPAAVPFRLQEGTDLGQRMAHAFADRLLHYRNVLLIGSDCPGIDGDYIAAALQALQKVPAVFGPARDGGYVLVGLNRPCPALFEGVPWGTGSVMDVTRQRLLANRLPWLELDTLADIDRNEDLHYLVCSAKRKLFFEKYLTV
jgi:rSAM/selenodomain-associated transferase 1